VRSVRPWPRATDLHTILTRTREDPPVTGSETATGLWRARGVPRAALVLVGLVVASTAIRFTAAQAFTTPWIAPDEMVYGLIGETLWSDGTLTLRGLPTPYYSLLTPALVGAPLAALDLGDGIQWARLLQALAMSLVAVPTYLWARRLASTVWALAAAAIVLAAPALHYSGFLMTEPLTLTMVTAALLALARALEEPTVWRHGVFVAWATGAAAVRLQALVLIPAFVLAAVIDALVARDRKRLRQLAGFAVAGAILAVLVAAVVAVSDWELSSRRLLGAYTPLGEETSVVADRVGEVAWHAFGVAVLGLGVAALATSAVAGQVLSGRERDPRLRAFVSVTLAYIALLVLQVGLFSAVFVGHVAERYLITALPPLAIGLAVWNARGAPRSTAFVAPVWGAIVLGAALIPIDQLATPQTLVNTSTPSALMALTSLSDVRAVLVALAVAAGALVLLLPRRLAWLTAVAVGLGLALASVDSGRRIADASEHEERVGVGSAAPTWVDDAGLDRATFLATGDRLWTSTARTIFWNRGIRDVVRLAPATVPFPPTTPAVRLAEDGTLVTDAGTALERHIVVAPASITLDGEKVAERPVGDSETNGLAAWRIDGPVRVLLKTEGFLPNGDFTGATRITVYRCPQGTLDVTVLGKTGDPVEAWIDGISVGRLATPAGEAVTHRIPTPPYADGSRRCVFQLENPGFAGSTRIAFTPA
jgi:Dolichyl-phosphate-mannose-protein mannosyltransferase